MFIGAIIIIFLISVVLALFSLRGQSARSEIKKAAKELSKGRVIFHKDQDSSSES
ncbi:MAG: hypothetical protein HYT08_04370 [Candidatus Levybacteria bacterium]|nr:hypothetical protein [Candidatus Levybacteria bacterium]